MLCGCTGCKIKRMFQISKLEENEEAKLDGLDSGEPKGCRYLCLLEVFFFMAAVVVDIYFSSLQ